MLYYKTTGSKAIYKHQLNLYHGLKSLIVFYNSVYTYPLYLLNLSPTFVCKQRISKLPDVCLHIPLYSRLLQSFSLKELQKLLIKQWNEKKMPVGPTSDEYLM